MIYKKFGIKCFGIEPLFDERLEIKDGRMFVPNRAGLGLTISELTRDYTKESHIFN